MKKLEKETEVETGKLLVIISDDHSGRDEMNLAGNPFALLHPAGKSKTPIQHIKYQWNRQISKGKTVEASWEVNGHAELGLPGPSDEMLYLVLLELTREAANGGQWPQIVHFSRAQLLDRLGWPDTKHYYGLLNDCFARLSATNIQARYAFYDAKMKAPAAFAAFNILDAAEIFDEAPGRKSKDQIPLSFFKWSDRLHDSHNAGAVRSLALDFVLSLKIPTARRLFRYLDMHRNADNPPRHEYKITLTKLRDHIGMVNVTYASKIKEKLAQAHEELIERGYLASVEYRKGNNGEIAIYHFAESKSSKAIPKALEAPKVKTQQEEPRTVDSKAAHAVWLQLSDAEKERLRGIARQGVEPAFWDRLERPDSPMGLKLWELVAQEYSQAYREKLEAE